MSPVLKYTLGRLGLFALVLLLLLPVPIDLLLKLMIAVVASFGLQFVLLRRWRVQMVNQVDRSMTRRRAARARLRRALAGEETDDQQAR